MDKLRIGEEMSAALRFVESGDFLAAATRCDQAASVCLVLGGCKFSGVDKLARARKDADDNHAAYCKAKDENNSLRGTIAELLEKQMSIVGWKERAEAELAEIGDIVADVKPDRDSEASGTVVERVHALVKLAGL